MCLPSTTGRASGATLLLRTIPSSAGLLSAHATTGAVERNWSLWGKFFVGERSSTKLETAEKVIFIKAKSRGGMAAGKDTKVKLDTLDLEEALDWLSEGEEDDEER